MYVLTTLWSVGCHAKKMAWRAVRVFDLQVLFSALERQQCGGDSEKSS